MVATTKSEMSWSFNFVSPCILAQSGRKKMDWVFKSFARKAKRPKNTPGLSSHLSQQQTMQWICIDGVAAGDRVRGFGYWGGGGSSANVQDDHHVRQVYDHTHTCTHAHAHVYRQPEGTPKTTTSTRKHHPHHPSQVVQLERRIKKKRRALLSTAAWNWLGKSLQPSLHATHHQTLREKPRTNSFKQKQERFSKNVCHCKTCLHAFTCPCWHSFTYC